MLTSGELIAGRYRLEGPIAAGGMGDVWRAEDIVLGRTVAIKMLRSHLAADPTFGARFRIEARSIASLHHPGVVSVYDYGEIDHDGALEMAYLVMALIDGDPLSARIAAAGQLPAAQTMAIMAQAARALDAAHNAGIIHRDVKPDNLLIDTEGRVILVDFGVAQASFSQTLTAAGQVVGTARYMAPEQISKRPLSAATDIYALGAVAYHCLAGHPPFTGDNAISVALNHLHDEPDPLPDSVPPLVRSVVSRAMAKDPQHRYASAAALAYAAESAMKDRLVDTVTDTEVIPPAVPSARKGAAPSDATAAIAGAGAAAAGAGAGTAAIRGVATPRRATGTSTPTETMEPAGALVAPAPGRRSRKRAVLAAVALIVVLATGGLLAAAFSPGRGGKGGGLDQTPVPPQQSQTNHPKGTGNSGGSGNSGSGSSGHGQSGHPSPSPSASTPADTGSTDTGQPTSDPTTTDPDTPGPTGSDTSGTGSGSGDGGGGSGGGPSSDPSSGANG